jgi:hypothetical protein
MLIPKIELSKYITIFNNIGERIAKNKIKIAKEYIEILY